jgi:diguanylate cyclase (GGDEF)-like protein
LIQSLARLFSETDDCSDDMMRLAKGHSFAHQVVRQVCGQEIGIAGGSKALSVSISVGVETTRDPTETTESLIGRADDALYRAKGRGRNCVSSAELDQRGLRQLGQPAAGR